MECMLCRRASVSGTFHWTRSAFNFRVGQITYLHNDRASHPRKCDYSTQPLRKLQIWCFLINQEGSATHGDWKSYGDQGIWNSNYFSHAQDQVQLNDRYVQHGSCRWVRKRRGHVIVSGFPHGADEVFVRLGCYAANVGSYLLTFRESPSVPPLRDKQSTKNAGNRRKSGYIWGMVRLGHCLILMESKLASQNGSCGNTKEEGGTSQQHRKNEKTPRKGKTSPRDQVPLHDVAIWTRGKRTKTPEGTPKSLRNNELKRGAERRTEYRWKDSRLGTG